MDPEGLLDDKTTSRWANTRRLAP